MPIDSFVAYFLNAPAWDALREATVKIAGPLVSQGELRGCHRQGCASGDEHLLRRE